MHRRKSSKEGPLEEMSTIAPTKQGLSNGTGEHTLEPSPKINGVHVVNGNSARPRTLSTPSTLSYQERSRPLAIPSPGPIRASYSSSGSFGESNSPPSPFRTTFGHSRARSTSRPIHSPLATSFQPDSPDSSSFQFPTSSNGDMPGNGPVSPGGPQNSRRHARIHSRNLSIFFPRPGSLPQSTILEDGTQEMELDHEHDLTAPVSLIPTASISGKGELSQGFTFGGRRIVSTSNDDDQPASATKPSRRGHHHKHSMSHNFFSFLEPGTQIQSQASQHSPQTPVTPFSAISTSTAAHSPLEKVTGMLHVEQATVPKFATALACWQFVLGSSIWVSGQQNGSLGCTGLGYWVVFDAFGVALGHVFPAVLSFKSMHAPIRRPFGSGRLETLLLFSQAVYLIFTSIYVCKETIEHVLLSAGEGHHHHHGDEIVDLIGIHYPSLLILLTIISLLISGWSYQNHSRLISATYHKLPFLSVFQSSRSRTTQHLQYTSSFSSILSNPFTFTPLLFSFALLFASTFLPVSQHRSFDLILAAAETVITFRLAYPASLVLGAVLLQTSPERGLPGGRMEAFLRAMREIERHPQVLHLPAPHIWQIAPAPLSSTTSHESISKNTLVVTLELHVRREMDDNDILALTRWAHDRCKSALTVAARSKGSDEEAEVTVGIVRG